MNTIKKTVLFLFGIVLLLFGNRDLLAKINKQKEVVGDDKNKSITPVTVAPTPATQTTVTPVSTSGNQTTGSASSQVTSPAPKSETTHRKKAKKVIKAEESTQATSKTTIEKEKPEKASSTQ